MSRDEANAVLALKNAWTGAIRAADRLKELEPAIVALAPETSVKDLDFETYSRASMAQAVAAMALRGLLEELQARATKAMT